MATDAELRDQAVAELKLTTAGWRKPNGNLNYPSGTAPMSTHWGKAMALLEQIGVEPEPEPPPPSGTQPGIGVMEFGGTLSASASHQSLYSLLVLDVGEASQAAALPGRTLVYTAGLNPPPAFDVGVPYQTALANGWLLKDANGNYIPLFGNTSYLADVGHPAYQQAFIDGVLKNFLKPYPGIDGIEIDNTTLDPRAASTSSAWPAKYPSAAAWHAAMLSFMKTVGPAIKAQGYYVMPNASGWIANDPNADSGVTTQQWYAELAPYVSGLMHEMWVQMGNDADILMDTSGTTYHSFWTGWQKLMSIAQSNGVDFIPVMNGNLSQTNIMRFGKGSFLLDWDGGRGSTFVFATRPAYTSNIDPWHAAWTADIGTPSAAKTQIQTNIWRRDFSKGVVIVNPTLSSFTTTVNGASRTIASKDALILQS